MIKYNRLKISKITIIITTLLLISITIFSIISIKSIINDFTEYYVNELNLRKSIYDSESNFNIMRLELKYSLLSDDLEKAALHISEFETSEYNFYENMNKIRNILQEGMLDINNKEVEIILSEFNEWKDVSTEIYNYIVDGEKSSAISLINLSGHIEAEETEILLRTLSENITDLTHKKYEQIIADTQSMLILILLVGATSLILFFYINFLSFKAIKRYDKIIKKETNFLSVVLKSIADGIIVIDSNEKILLFNDAAQGITGWTRKNALGNKLSEVYFTTFNNEAKKLEIGIGNNKVLRVNAQSVLITKDAKEKYIENKVSPILYIDNDPKGAIISFRDITKIKEQNEKIIHLSNNDTLTGLYNRKYFDEAIKELNSKGNYYSLILGDLNGLKLINDTFGHITGDNVIKDAAKNIKNVFSFNDLVFRWGGDEFVILCDITDEDIIKKYIMEIKKQNSSCKNGGEVSISFGYAIKKLHTDTIEKLFNEAEDKMYRNKLHESPLMKKRTIDHAKEILFNEYEGEETHSMNVAEKSFEIGKALKLDKSEISELITTAQMHDIGKITINKNIFNQRGKLTASQWEEVKRHSETGYRMLSSTNEVSKIAISVLAHHERWDGTGYPKGLKGKEIPLHARIISVADAYDSMKSGRVYKEALTDAEIIEEFTIKSGVQFDPELVELIINIMKNGI